jgi:hypothetical protein
VVTGGAVVVVGAGAVVVSAEVVVTATRAGVTVGLVVEGEAVDTLSARAR